jgi:photosystem II stability/assembly factor-like uncharacterized protein
MAYSLTPNSANNNGVYIGRTYAFNAQGGFKVSQTINQINLAAPDALAQYDISGSVQLRFSSRTLNKKLGIMKDTSNINVVEALYDPQTDFLLTDSIKVCTCDFIDGINTGSVISVGQLQYLYSDFKYTVGAYFGDPNGFASLFSQVNEFDINNGGVFDASAFVQVINSAQFNMTGSFISDLSGFVTISNINKTLQYALDGNVFENRFPSANKLNYGVVDGFIAGDLIFIPEGFTITLSIDVQPETILPINNIGPTNLNAIYNKINWTRGYIKRSTTFSTTNITQVTTLPVLLSLTDDTLQNYTNFGASWTVSTNVVYNGVLSNPNKNWVAISISTTGRYQTAITDTGDIYVSDDYGARRTVAFNIGVSPSNTVAISFTGQYQTASEGHNIYVSNNYGATCTKTISNGTSNIFVSISLTGKYQTIVSSGDTVYTSSNYGISWKPLDINSDLFDYIVNSQNDLYQSVELFPVAGVALSYNGLYQTIVAEFIYVSSDFGQTWKNVSNTNNIDQRNWACVAMSSDGKYQTALENYGEVYCSKDFGITWTVLMNPAFVDNNWISVSLSATGQYQTIVQQGGIVYCSNDYGANWTAVPDSMVRNKDFREVAISSDAIYQCVCEYGGQIYMSNLMVAAPTCVCEW